tara:strand:+ start:2410 stop:2700 length:291 start_codon:yes stop_codon:yes gene_type:complete
LELKLLVKIKQLLVENNGYKRDLLKKDIFINSDKVVSISDYHAIEEFILSENLDLKNEKFSLVKISEGQSVNSIIAFGTAEEITKNFIKKVEILHD